MRAKDDNPWGLTPGQARAMRAVCEHGGSKLAAAALNVSVKSIEKHLYQTKTKMPEQRTVLSRILAWDRWDRYRSGEGTK